MKKIAIYWEKRFNNNNFWNIEIDKNLSPYLEIINVNWQKHTCSLDLLENRKDKNDYLILCFLTLTIFTIIPYIKFFIKYYKNKKYFIIYEPIVVSRLNYNKLFHFLFNRIYTWNDKLVDNKKYFKFIVPSSFIGFYKYDIDFEKRKLLTLINWNHNSWVKDELYTERKNLIKYLEWKNIEFDLYWRNWNKPINLMEKIFWFYFYKSYRGTIENKIEVLSNYKFNICFENMCNIPWNITEKIWDSFKARSIPIYFWASDIDKYIPSSCFIDYRKFNWNYDELINYILNINKKTYDTYIKNIDLYLKTEKSQIFFDKKRATDFINNL
jgi:hypothetical protein